MNRQKLKSLNRALVFPLLIMMAGCVPLTEESDAPDTSAQSVIPKDEPLSDTGNDPYVVDGILYVPLTELDDYSETGRASWYGQKFHGKKTSSGEIYDMYQFSAAHKTLPIPSYIEVTNLANNKSMVIRVNDRGPFIGPRILDLSYAAAKELGFVTQGTTEVRIKSISKIMKSDSQSLTAGLVYLQTGVYSKQQNALLAKMRLESEGYKVEVDNSDDRLYKVKVGPYETALIAYNEKQDLEKILHQPVMLITDK